MRPGRDDGGAAGKRGVGDVLGQRLGEAVRRDVAVLPRGRRSESLRGLVDQRLGQHAIRCGETHRVGPVGRDRRHEEVLAHRIPERLGAQLDPAIVAGVVVEHHVPLALAERAEVVVAIADQVLDVADVGLGLSAGQDRHAMPALDGVPHRVRTDESRAAQDQHGLRRGRLRRRRRPRDRRPRGAGGGRTQRQADAHQACRANEISARWCHCGVSGQRAS